MAGFRNIGEWTAALENGQHWSVTINKNFLSATSPTAGKWFDWMYIAGSPGANYYASSPLVASLVDSGVRAYLPSVSPSKQFLHKASTIVVSNNVFSSATGISSQQMLLDYLLYYPFIDFTAVGEVQAMSNPVSLPRYSDGVGVQMMLVAQSAVVGSGRMTVTYINSDGVQKTTPLFYVGVHSLAGGICISANATDLSALAFIPLAAGDKGVRSVVSADVTVDGGGIGAIVLVKPLVREMTTAPSIRLNTGGVVHGAFSQTEFILNKQPIRIYDGAHLGIIGNCINGTETTKILCHIETIWN